MYLVPADQFHKHVRPPKNHQEKAKRPAIHPYKKWVRMRRKIREEEMERNSRTKTGAEFLNRDLPVPAVAPTYKQTSTQKEKAETYVAAIPSEIYETETGPHDDTDVVVVVDEDDDYVEDEAKRYGRKEFGAVASSYLLPNLYNRRFLDTQYGIRKDGDTFMIGDSTLTVDRDGDITVKGKHFEGMQGLCELLTRKNVKHEIVTTDDMKTYKTILLLTHAHLTGYEPDGNINVSRGAKFQKVISRLFPLNRKQRAIESTLRRKWAKY